MLPGFALVARSCAPPGNSSSASLSAANADDRSVCQAQLAGVQQAVQAIEQEKAGPGAPERSLHSVGPGMRL